MLIIVMPIDQMMAVASAMATPFDRDFFSASPLPLFFSRLSSHIPKTIADAPKMTLRVTDSPTKKIAQRMVKSGYVQVIGTARETPMLFRLTMYKVSPMPKPIMPLTPARIRISVLRLAKTLNLPNTASNTIRNTPVAVRRMMFAERGLASCSAFPYSRAETVQLIAAPSAASSPIMITSLLELQKEIVE